jgi:hypothetical protein
MRSNTYFLSLWPSARIIFLTMLALTTSLTHAATFWTGTNIGFFHQQGGPPDPIISAVALSRNAGGPLFNTAAGESFSNGFSSPIDTMWAFGTLANATNLTYVTFPSLRNGDTAGVILNKPMVLHLTNEDIYISVMFTNWTQFGNQTGIGSFGYTRSTAPASPPTVSITSPTNGASFVAPANVNITTLLGGGTVTNVTFRAGTNVLGTVTAAPFNFTASNLAAGSYALTAVATAGGLSTTSSVVNITVANSTSVVLSSPQISNGQFIFSFNAIPGSNYVVQSSSTLSNWTSLSTNVAAGSTVSVTNPVVPSSAVYYRVGQTP